VALGEDRLPVVAAQVGWLATMKWRLLRPTIRLLSEREAQRRRLEHQASAEQTRLFMDSLPLVAVAVRTLLEVRQTVLVNPVVLAAAAKRTLASPLRVRVLLIRVTQGLQVQVVVLAAAVVLAELDRPEQGRTSVVTVVLAFKVVSLGRKSTMLWAAAERTVALQELAAVRPLALLTARLQVDRQIRGTVVTVDGRTLMVVVVLAGLVSLLFPTRLTAVLSQAVDRSLLLEQIEFIGSHHHRVRSESHLPASQHVHLTRGARWLLIIMFVARSAYQGHPWTQISGLSPLPIMAMLKW
jgi:hypothetical protein